MSGDSERYIFRSVAGLLLAAGGVLVLAQCDLAAPGDRPSLVVEAFLTTGDSLSTITLRHTRPLNDPGDQRANAAQGAAVELLLGEQSVSYREHTRRPGRYVPVNGPDAVPARVPWQLAVRWENETAQARGTTPPPITLQELCMDVPEAPVRAVMVDSLRRDSLDIPAEQSYLFPVDVTLRWSADRLAAGEDTTHWVRPRLQPDTTGTSSRVINFFLEPAEVRREDRFRRADDHRTWTGVYAVPAADSTAPFPRHDLTATLTRGDSAFAAFARSRDDPERREPISNVEGGLGIATAVALDSLRRSVAPDLDRCRSPE